MRAAIIAFLLGTTALICPPTAARADTTGSVAGHVIDALTGAPIAGASVDIQSPANIQKTITDGKGYYVALCLIPSIYTITVARTGYVTVAQPGVIVGPARQSVADVRLPKQPKFTLRLIDRTAFDIVQPNRTADVYVLTPWNAPYFDNPALGAGYMLNFVPGVQSGGVPNPR